MRVGFQTKSVSLKCQLAMIDERFLQHCINSKCGRRRGHIKVEFTRNKANRSEVMASVVVTLVTML